MLMLFSVVNAIPSPMRTASASAQPSHFAVTVSIPCVPLISSLVLSITLFPLRMWMLRLVAHLYAIFHTCGDPD